MKIKKIAIDKLKFDPRNARLHDDRNIGAVVKSLEEFGQQRPIIVDEDNVVRAGNGLLEAAKELGWKEISIVVTELKGSDLKAYGIADNRTAELSDWNYEVLGEHFSEMAEIDFDIESTGFEEYEAGVIMNAEWTPDFSDGESSDSNKDSSPPEKKESGEDLEFSLNERQFGVYKEAFRMVLDKENSEMSDSEVVLYICEDYLRRSIKKAMSK
jgi:site-specific DNA-methyltransferase (adenine-specific)